MAVEAIDTLAAGQLERDVKDTIAHLENGAGDVPGCKGHKYLAHGVVLCLRLMLLQWRKTGASARNHVAASALATFTAVLLMKLMEALTK